MGMMCPTCYREYEAGVVTCPSCQRNLTWVEAVSDEARLYGFGGWLIWFALGLVIAFPVIAALGLFTSFRLSGRLYAYYPGMLAVFMIDALFKVVLTIWGFYVVYALVKLVPFAGETARKYLVGRAVYTGLSIVFPFISTLPPIATAVFTGWAIFTAVPSLAFIAVWYVYFKRSKRVEVTYGRPETGGAWLA